MRERFDRPDWVRRINAMGDSLGADGARGIVPLDPDAMLAAVLAALDDRPRSELADFGDRHWESRYRDLVAVADGAPLTVVGRLATRQEIMRCLRTRFELGRVWDAAPAIAAEIVAAPVIVTGPARSGTTILFELLWLDPTLRGPVGWEALHPVAFPDDIGGIDRRPTAAESEQEFWADIQPEFAAMHELRSDLPVECVTLTAPCFCGPHWSMVLPANPPQDIDEMYAFHRRILQVIQHDDPARTWLLKTPAHLALLDHVFATYPDAWVVQTHRDPAKTMPSTVSITATVQWMRTDDVDLEPLAEAVDLAFGAVLNSVAERRAAGELPDRFVDVHFRDLLRDPVDTLRRAYDTMGRVFTDEHAEAVGRYLTDKPKGKFGVHRYTPEEWGFDAEELHDRLALYIDHFGVELET